jgi:hypothetical protein
MIDYNPITDSIAGAGGTRCYSLFDLRTLLGTPVKNIPFLALYKTSPDYALLWAKAPALPTYFFAGVAISPNGNYIVVYS